MAVDYQLQNPENALSTEQVGVILDVIDRSVRRAEELLGPLEILLAVEPERVPRFCSEQLPIVGYTPNANNVLIRIAPEHARVEDPQWQALLSATTAHELHHGCRWKDPGYGKTIGERLITEGLAQCFESEIVPGFVAPYSQNLTQDQLSTLSEKAAKICDVEDREISNRLFYGQEGNPEFPRWGGYSLGYAIVKAWLEKTGRTAVQAVHVPASEVLEPWLKGELPLVGPTPRLSIEIPGSTQSGGLTAGRSREGGVRG